MVTPFDTFTGADRNTVLSLLSFFDLLGHASLIGRSSTWNFSDHGFAAPGRPMARETGSVGDPRMMRAPSASVYSCGSLRLAWYTSTDGCSSRSGSATTTTERSPVPSSSSSRNVTPGTRSFQRNSPSVLMMLGSLYGSQVYRIDARCSLSPLITMSFSFT